MQENKEFWESQAEKFKHDVKAVNFDKNEEELEHFFLKSILRDSEKICDLGCGNGRTIFSMICQGIDSEFYGIDFAKGMIDVANKTKTEKKISNAHFFNMSAASEDLAKLFSFKFDTVLSKRLLINLKGDSKFKAIDNIHSILKESGIYIMIECFEEPLYRVNFARKNIGLKEIEVHDFNEYLKTDFLQRIETKFIVERVIDFESLYYFISRIFNAYLSEGAPSYDAGINKLSLLLSKLNINPIAGYSPQLIYVLRKVSHENR